MRSTSGGAFAWSGTDAVPIAAAMAVPTLVTDGHSALIGQIPNNVADEWKVSCRFPTAGGCDSTVVTFRPWTYTAGSWSCGTLYTLKATSDADGGAIAFLPGDGSAERLYLQLVTVDGATPGAILEAFHSEHSEVM